MIVFIYKWLTNAVFRRPVWALCAGLSLMVHAVGWTVKAGSQYKALPAEAAVDDDDDDGGGDAERKSERTGLLQAPAADSDDNGKGDS